MKVKEFSVGLSKKYSINYNSVSVDVAKTVQVEEGDDVRECMMGVFTDLDEFSDDRIQKMVDEI